MLHSFLCVYFAYVTLWDTDFFYKVWGFGAVERVCS